MKGHKLQGPTDRLVPAAGPVTPLQASNSSSQNEHGHCCPAVPHGHSRGLVASADHPHGASPGSPSPRPSAPAAHAAAGPIPCPPNTHRRHPECTAAGR